MNLEAITVIGQLTAILLIIISVSWLGNRLLLEPPLKKYDKVIYLDGEESAIHVHNAIFLCQRKDVVTISYNRIIINVHKSRIERI